MASDSALTRYEIVMAGLGGQGVLTAGRLLATAAMEQYKHVLWYPSYASAMRGGQSECTIIVSQEEIPSPIPPKVEAVAVFESRQLEAYKGRLRPGGIAISESTGLAQGAVLDGVVVRSIPAASVAVAMGGIRMMNLVLLGAVVAVTGKVPLEVVEAHLVRKFPGNAQLNVDALHEGARLATVDTAAAGGRGR